MHTLEGRGWGGGGEKERGRGKYKYFLSDSAFLRYHRLALLFEFCILSHDARLAPIVQRGVSL